MMEYIVARSSQTRLCAGVPLCSFTSWKSETRHRRRRGGLGRGRLRMGESEGQKQRAVHMEMAVQERAKTFLQFLLSSL